MSVIGVIRLVGYVLAGLIVVGIVLVATSANEENVVVDAILSVDRALTGPFRGIFDLEPGREHLQIAINWGIAAVVYLAVFLIVAGLLRRLVHRRKPAR